ncbi:Beta-1,4-mannooligosaccharide phosphorylase [Posidoniimonas polymericola]|uniref:Beta-1,4-mannooligosaccharide phosphorylase n=1 Tax=Posidoniimonas polymericola TaxID=2528002 RepID=A0A5C5ZD03_9BACT|nr:glycoside hydrolase family 130 protein [Posidoniimonas polymericola]TWT85289.1 Beta-1,4-mannooligosaccharide phosphorylase [Posidoniimonas polymericola]
MLAKRTGIILKPDSRRVVLRPFIPSAAERRLKIVARVSALPDAVVDDLIGQVLQDFHGRHQRPGEFFGDRFQDVREHVLTDASLSENRKLLIGAYFTQEYALESAALFNPSMVWHPDQSNVPNGSKRFLLSLRAIGEGHLSSITFRSGTVDAANKIVVDEPTRFATAPRVAPDAEYDKALFTRKLAEMGLSNRFTRITLGRLGVGFTLEELEASLTAAIQENRAREQEFGPTRDGVRTLARSNYEIAYTAEQDLSERLIFPYGPTETNGIEDARFVEFQREDGSVRYYATYSAYDGKIVLPQLLETKDFLRFRMHTLNGPAVANKGLALFPRTINGRYVMLSRQDGENLYVMDSDNLCFWHDKRPLAKPTNPWEFVQIGNCGSPIELDEGWLVLTHGVGPMRRYCIGAMLLDLDDPTRVIRRLTEPLLTPDENEREGYVPNVVYSCGAAVHNNELILPYAMSDYASSFATVNLDELLSAMDLE